jgi:uncharacterized protein
MSHQPDQPAADSPLATSPSPFLRHGATQPVRWQLWGEEALARAQRLDRPILLDIGAVWCHWCHVMDRESYEDEETARLINELFVPVKVDRDERPDVDARYQRAVQLMTGQGGWPLTAFLTPAGEVFFGGTYFPPDDRYGRPSLKRVLVEIARVWRDEKGRARESAQALRSRLEEVRRAESLPGELDPRLVHAGVEAFARAFDFRYGGFGGAPKFPNAGALLLLLDHHIDTGFDWAARIVRETLGALARGGIHDQLGGGFHRYATDARWLIPHFEKMAYDNGPLLQAYARAYAVLPDELYLSVGRGMLRHHQAVAPALLERGGFPASQDADVGPEDDGDYWTWTLDEVHAALGGDERLVQVAQLTFGLDDPGSAMPSDRERHVPYRAHEPRTLVRELEVDEAEAGRLVAEVERRLLAAREQRPAPYVDDTVYIGWTALVASGYLAAARHLGLDGAEPLALRALTRIWDESWDGHEGVAHRVGSRGDGLLDDHAHFAAALLDAFELTQDGAWLERAAGVVDVLRNRFRDDDGAFLDRPRERAAPGALTEPHRPVTDTPEPAGNAVAALALLRLDALLPEQGYAQDAERVLRAFAGAAEQMPTALATYLRALDWAVQGPTSVAVVAKRSDARGRELLAAALGHYRPRTVVRLVGPDEAQDAALPAEIRAMLTGEAPRAYVCAGRSCAPPVAEPAALTNLLRALR